MFSEKYVCTNNFENIYFVAEMWWKCEYNSADNESKLKDGYVNLVKTCEYLWNEHE